MVATGDTFCEKSPKNNFLTNEPIFTNNIPIDSARQAKETSKFFKIRFRGAIGEFLSEKYPLE
jgi:hypothetical protein